MKKIVSAILTLIVISFVFIGTPVFASGGSGIAGYSDICNGGAGIESDALAAAGCEAEGKSVITNIATGIQIAISFVGIMAVLVVVMGGQRYITSSGDPGKAKQAKDMILYGVIAVVVAVLSYAIINFVIIAIGK